MNGVVVDIYKGYVKVHTPKGEKILKIKGRKNFPEKGWILEFKKDDPYAQFQGNVVVDSMVALPPLNEVIPIVEAAKTSRPDDIIFLAEVTRNVYRRLGKLPGWYYKRLGEYYQQGEAFSEKHGIMSSSVAKLLKKEGIEFQKGKVDPNRAFGYWLRTFSSPLEFRSYNSGSGKRIRLYIRKTLSSFRIKVEYLSKEYGEIFLEGEISKVDTKLKLVSDKIIDSEKIKVLEENLKRFVSNVLIVQGGKGLGFYV
ncbi:MAG: hypothetical protein J7L34_02230 [Thermotogaceae bacterium]|nr:hypothetical protein [Thermotogaceae bacterium]